MAQLKHSIGSVTRIALLALSGCTLCTGALAAASSVEPSVDFRGLGPRVALSVKPNAHSVFADDMNEDGRIDLIVAVAGADSVAYFAGRDDGTFADATYWPVGKTPKYAVTADFNGDGHRDMVVADQDNNSISVLLGNGDGTFKPQVSYPACSGDHEVAVADFNGDSKDDVVVACHREPYSAALFLGNGDGTLQPKQDLAAGAEPTAVVVGDFDHNGVPDLAFANRAGSAVSILLGNGDGTFKTAVQYATSPSPHAVRTGDLNGDGFLDLVTANDHSNNVSVLYGKGDGTFAAHTDLPANSLPKSIAIADVNNDGHPDIVITNTTYPTCCTVEGSTVSVFVNLGNGTFAPRRDYFAGGNPFSLLVRDLNGDGKLDVATANFVDQTQAQHIYLEITHAVGLAGRTARLAGLGVIGLLGLAIGLFGWKKYRWAGLLCTVIIFGIAAGWFYKFSKLRMESDAHVSILSGL